MTENIDGYQPNYAKISQRLESSRIHESDNELYAAMRDLEYIVHLYHPGQVLKYGCESMISVLKSNILSNPPGSFVRLESRYPHTTSERDLLIAYDRLTKREKCAKPLDGDYLICPDGKYRRIAYIWGDGDKALHQVEYRTDSGSYYLCDSGNASMSGGLDPGFTRDRIKQTTETRETRFWFFHNDHATAHNGVDLICRVKVWEVIPESAEEKEENFAKSDGGSE